MNLLRSTIPSTRGKSLIDTPRKVFGSYPDFDINSVNKEMCEHQGYYGHANTLLTRKKGKDDLCMFVYLCPIKDNLLNGVSVKVQARQSLDIPLGCFLVVQQK